MSIITLTTDLGLKDSYLASVKGNIYKQLPNAKIIDITNQITPFNIHQAAFILKNCFKEFPIGTINIISVNEELDINSEHIAVKSEGYYFIGTDNGFFSLLLDELKPDNIVKLNLSQNSNCMTFAIKNIFVPAACHIARGGTLEIIGSKMLDFEVKKTSLQAAIDKNSIKGSVIYVDNYGNAITNISKEVFYRVKKNRNFNILFGRENENITKICEKYKEVRISDKLAIFGENNFLQISINQGKANKLLGLKLHEIIRIEFQ